MRLLRSCETLNIGSALIHALVLVRALLRLALVLAFVDAHTRAFETPLASHALFALLADL